MTSSSKARNSTANKINIKTDNLVVASLQDTSSSKSKSSGGNIGVSGNGLDSVGINASKGEANRAMVDQQTSITGTNLNIKARDTKITGDHRCGNQNDDGNTTDKLTLKTDTLTVANIQDSDESKDSQSQHWLWRKLDHHWHEF